MLWTAPVPDYAPSFLKNEKVGYVLSALFGSGLILLVFLGLGWIAQKTDNARDTVVS